MKTTPFDRWRESNIVEVSESDFFSPSSGESAIYFSSLCSDTGNEEHIARIVTKLLTMLTAKGYVNADTGKPLPQYTAQLRKITFFLVLNTDANCKYDLMSDHTVSHLLNAFPQMTKCLLLACIWGLSLDAFLYECIAYTPIWFAFAFVEDATESLKYADPYETLDRVDDLVRAIYTNIARSDYRSVEMVEKKIILNKYYDVTMDLLRHFFSPSNDSRVLNTKPKQYKYMGYVLKHNLELLMHCFDLFQHKPSLKHSSHDIYALMREREPLVDNLRETYSDPVTETLHRFNTTILNSLQNNVMHVDMHMYMYWVEIKTDAGITLQQAVGEAAYHVEQLINMNECFQHGVSAQLKEITIKPLTVEERAEQSSIAELIDKLEQWQIDDKYIGVWLREFIKRGELVLGNAECLEALELHVQSLTAEDVRDLIKYAASIDIENGCVVEEKLIECCLAAFDHLSETVILDLIQFSMDQQQQQHFGYMQLENFDSFLIRVLNKTQFGYDRIIYLKLLFQNPQRFYEKLLQEALSSEVQMLQMIEILRVTSRIFKPFLETHLKSLMETKCSANDRFVAPLVPKLIAQLFHLNVIEPSTFIIDNIYKKYFVPALQAKNLPRIALIINALLLSVQQKYSFDGFAAPLLVMSAQIIELFRWTVISFDDDAVTVVTKTIEFVQEVLKKFLPTANDKDKKWILSKIGAYAQLTKFYFQKLSLTKEQSIVRFVDFLRPPESTSNDNHQSGIKFLCEHIVRCTSKEIKWLAESDELLSHFHAAMQLIATIVVRSKNKPESDCLRYCLNAYFGIVKVIIICEEFLAINVN